MTEQVEKPPEPVEQALSRARKLRQDAENEQDIQKRSQLLSYAEQYEVYAKIIQSASKATEKENFMPWMKKYNKQSGMLRKA